MLAWGQGGLALPSAVDGVQTTLPGRYSYCCCSWCVCCCCSCSLQLVAAAFGTLLTLSQCLLPLLLPAAARAGEELCRVGGAPRLAGR